MWFLGFLGFVAFATALDTVTRRSAWKHAADTARANRASTAYAGSGGARRIDA